MCSNVCNTRCGGALFNFDISVLNEFLNKAYLQSNVLTVTTKVHVVRKSDATCSVVLINIGSLELPKL